MTSHKVTSAFLMGLIFKFQAAKLQVRTQDGPGHHGCKWGHLCASYKWPKINGGFTSKPLLRGPRQSRILRQPLGPVFVVAKWLQVPIGYNQWGQMDRFHEKLRGWSSSIVPVHTAPWVPRVDFWGSTG